VLEPSRESRSAGLTAPARVIGHCERLSACLIHLISAKCSTPSNAFVRREIHRRTGVHRDTTRQALASPVPPSYGRPPPGASKLDLFDLDRQGETRRGVRPDAATRAGVDHFRPAQADQYSRGAYIGLGEGNNRGRRNEHDLEVVPKRPVFVYAGPAAPSSRTYHHAVSSTTSTG
jgi:hypothetical protein